jgi:hypothetical protein
LGELELKGDHNTLVKEVAEIVARESIEVLCIDHTGVGNGLDSFLEPLIGRICKVIPFISVGSPIDNSKYLNLRAECYFTMQKWLKTARILESHKLVSDLIILPYKWHRTKQVKQVLSKEEIHGIYHKSPDFSDALMMTFHHDAVPSLEDEGIDFYGGFEL